VSVNADKLLNWIIEQRPIVPNASASGRNSNSGASSTLSSVANLMGMKGITITKDTTKKATGIPNNLINIKGITVQKVSDDIEILEDDPIYELPPTHPQQPRHRQQQQQHHISHQSPPVNARLQPLAASSPIRGGGGNVGIRGNPIIRPMPYATARGRLAHVPMVAGRGGAPRGMVRGRGGVQNNVMHQNTLLKQQEAAIEKWANSCEHGCRICRRDGKSFTTLIRQNIVKHIETVHNISEKDYKAEFKVQSLITRASNHVCSLCNAKVKRLPNSLSSHMKKHQMTIRQYWMKYVAPQNSPLATFQPRTMQGGKSGAIRPIHPAMRGMPSGMRVMRGARGGQHHTVMRRGGGFTPTLKKDSIVIGEVFSVNGAPGNEEDSNQDYYDDEITIDEKNVHLLDSPSELASSQAASLNDSTSTTMEVDVDPLAMMDSETEDSKDFIKLEGVPVKGEPPSEEAFEVDLDSIRDNKADIKPFIKQEMDIKPDISGSMPIIGDAVSEAEGQPTEGEAEGQQTEEETEEQPAKKRKIDHEEEQEKESEMAEESSSQYHTAIEITPPTDVDPAAATEADANNKDEDGDNAETNDDDLQQEEEGENMFEIVSCQGEDNINDQEPTENDQVDQCSGEVDNAADTVTEQTDEQNNLLDELNDVLESVEANESNFEENVNYDQNSAQFVETEDISNTNTNVDEESNVDSSATMREFTIDGSEIGPVLQDNISPVPDDNNTDDMPAQSWDTMKCPYENQQCPLYCCHVRALQEVEEGATDWTRPYGPPANGGEPCTCCTNSDE